MSSSDSTTRVPALVTFGHGTLGQDDIVALLHAAGVEEVVDIRTAPGSRRHPHVGRAELESWLPAAGIAYRWERRLGGFRKVAPDSPDVAWRNLSFRGYAGWAREPAFGDALDEVLHDADARRTAVMCSEAVWWRCHRRVVADVVVLGRGRPVEHLFHDGRLERHRPEPSARRLESGLLVYDRT